MNIKLPQFSCSAVKPQFSGDEKSVPVSKSPQEIIASQKKTRNPLKLYLNWLFERLFGKMD